MNEEVTAEARQKKQQMIDGFLGDLVKQLRAMIYEATTDILATMSKNQGKLHPRSVVQLRNLIEQVGQMNFFGDTETDAMIRRVRSIFDKRPETHATPPICRSPSATSPSSPVPACLTSASSRAERHGIIGDAGHHARRDRHRPPPPGPRWHETAETFGADHCRSPVPKRS